MMDARGMKWNCFSSAPRALSVWVTSAALLCGSLCSWPAAMCAQRSATEPIHPNPQLDNPATERRIDELIAHMTLEEKLAQMVVYGRPQGQPVITGPADLHAAPAMGSISLGPAFQGSVINLASAVQTNELQHEAIEHSRLHIPLLFGSDVIHGYRTIYPIPLAVAATFDTDLDRRLTRMAAEEASTAGVRWVYAPMVDISRDPRWGRVMEGSGEDAFLGAALARAAVEGYQGTSLANPDSVAACVKHYAAYGAAEAGRDYAPAELSRITLRQVYLKPYEAAVRAGAASLMSSFNTVDGVPATANHFLLTDVLRGEWHFDGAVVSDSGAVAELVAHGVALDQGEAARRAVTAGLDIEMNSHTYQKNLPQLVQSGAVPMGDIDAAVRRVLRIKFALGLFDHPYVDPAKEVFHAVPEHRALARQAAIESFVLLQNHSVAGRPLLPLASAAHQTIALIGPFADSAGDMLGAWSIAGKSEDVVTPLTAIRERVERDGGQLLYAEGTSARGTEESGFPAALDAAQKADVVLMALGEPRSMVGEATSRASLDLPGNQLQLLQAVAALGKPIVLIVFSGRPLILNWAAEHLPAILQAWHPGVEAGPALAAVLFGDSSPSGKLPISFPRAVGQEPLYYNELPTGRPPGNADLSRPPTQSTKYLSRYIDVPNSPLFPFGFGLSYTTFTYSDLKLSRSTLVMADGAAAGDARSKQSLLRVSCKVTNSGTRTGDEVAQLYMGIRGTSVSQPVRTLRGFRRLSLAPGASAMVSFDLSFDDLAFYDSQEKLVMEPSRYTFWMGGDSSASLSASIAAVP
jgi:beta-glucosidase